MSLLLLFNNGGAQAVGPLAVTTQVTLVASGRYRSNANPLDVIVENFNSEPVYLGGPNVAVSGANRGIKLTFDQSIALSLVDGDILYAIAANVTYITLTLRSIF